LGIRINFFGPWRNRLGESPLWDGEAGLLYWVDSTASRICRAAPSGVGFEAWTMPQTVGSIGLAESGLVAVLRDGFYVLDLRNHGVVSPIALPERDNSAVRFNDGKADRQGRFLAGTMRVGDANTAPGMLYRLERDGSCSVLERDLAVSNALCFSPGGDQLYLADTLQGLIWRYAYDVVTGDVADRRLFADTRTLGSLPDGATVDAEGHLWVALVQAQRLARFAPDGRLVRTIDLPIPFPSCPAFGGEDLRTLFVTTIADSGHRLRSDHPDAGRLLAIDGLGVHGLPEARCRTLESHARLT
jgi:sugar lactone lactonase YvrE